MLKPTKSPSKAGSYHFGLGDTKIFWTPPPTPPHPATPRHTPPHPATPLYTPAVCVSHFVRSEVPKGRRPQKSLGAPERCPRKGCTPPDQPTRRPQWREKAWRALKVSCLISLSPNEKETKQNDSGAQNPLTFCLKMVTKV